MIIFLFKTYLSFSEYLTFIFHWISTVYLSINISYVYIITEIYHLTFMNQFISTIYLSLVDIYYLSSSDIYYLSIYLSHIDPKNVISLWILGHVFKNIVETLIYHTFYQSIQIRQLPLKKSICFDTYKILLKDSF